MISHQCWYVCTTVTSRNLRIPIQLFCDIGNCVFFENAMLKLWQDLLHVFQIPFYICYRPVCMCRGQKHDAQFSYDGIYFSHCPWQGLVVKGMFIATWLTYPIAKSFFLHPSYCSGMYHLYPCGTLPHIFSIAPRMCWLSWPSDRKVVSRKGYPLVAVSTCYWYHASLLLGDS